MGTTLTERMAVLETKFDTVVVPMANKVDEIYERMSNRPKDEQGKPVERRNGWSKWKKRAPIIALLISFLTFVGGWQACEYAEAWFHNEFQKYSTHLDSE